MLAPISRRVFISEAAALAAAFSTTRRHIARPTPSVLRLGAVDLSATRDAGRRLGVTLGVEEATHAAAMFGGTVELASLSAEELRLAGLSAVIGDDDGVRCIAMARRAAESGVVFMNVACGADALRGESCGATTFHVAPSAAMCRDAVALAGGGRAVAWTASLERFGADTLNHRFSARFGQDMTADAWAGWMAVKILWESSLRARSTEPRALAGHMARDATQFDGHKGRALSFRAWDHQLRQPLYVIREVGLIEQPAPAAPNESSREALDRLGATSAAPSCRMEP